MIPTLIQRRGAQHIADEEATKGPAPADVPALSPPLSVVQLIPESVARAHTVLAVRLDGRTVHVATADPSDILLRDKLSFLLNKYIAFAQYPRDEIRDAIDRLYGRTETESADSYLTEFTDRAIEVAPARRRAENAAAKRKNSERRRLFDPEPVAVVSGAALRSADLDEMATRETTDDLGPRQQGEERAPNFGRSGMFWYTVEEGQRALMIRKDGRMEVIVGPRQVWQRGRRFERMRHFVAHPGDFLVVRFRDGRQEHIAGPTELWFDPRVHEAVSREEALQLAAKEAVVVYAKAAENQPISRRLVHGPTLFVPAPGEWLHTFAWHGAEGGSQGAKKVSKGLVFQKLWQMPDQMYHDVTDVRTADDAVLIIKLMVFFELLDIERMLETTHDPIGDFINAATSDVVDFLGHRTFEEFKKETGRLNELEAYRQLAARAAQNGYRVNKVVYRGYDAPPRLQTMHDQAIEARTKLQLERATEQQAQDLEDFKLTAQMNRAARRRTEQAIEVDTEIDLTRKRQEAERTQKEAERTSQREQRRRDIEAEQEVRARADERQRAHLERLKEMGVDLTALLTQGRADKVIELRGGKGVSPHLHLDGTDGDA